MRTLLVYIEINGKSEYVGKITGENFDDACFTYDLTYLNNPKHRAISIGLPLEEKTFNALRTKTFFDGLLPEGFTRRSVAKWMHKDENDYLSILSSLGRECLGAIKIIENFNDTIKSEYQELSKEEIYALASEGTTESVELVIKSHLSLTGASGKVGLYYNEINKKWYLPIGEAPSTHIVKQSHVRLKKIIANEQLCLLTAKNLGIEIPESFIVTTDKNDDETLLLATKRYDRYFGTNDKVINGLLVPYRLHQEDFAQALGISSTNKYEKNKDGYMKKIFKVIQSYSANPLTDSLRLWDICVFNYLIGNTDNHIKNISLLYSEDLKSIRLAPAYDIVSTMIYENSSEEMALSIDDKYNINEISRESFKNEAVKIGLGTKIAMKHFDAMVGGFKDAMEQAKQELNAWGIKQVEEIGKQIIEKGGIKKELDNCKNI